MRSLFVLINALAATFLVVGAAVSQPEPTDDGWSTLAVPGTWEDAGHDHDGVAWYRSKVNLPAAWKGERVELRIEQVDNAHEAYVNGTKVGGAGAFPPNYANGIDSPQRYVVDPKLLRFGAPNVIAIRVFDADGRGGFKGPAPAIVGENRGIWLSGAWEFRTGDDPDWAKVQPADVADAAMRTVQLPAFKFRELASTGDDVVPPRESVAAMTTPDDLVVEAVLAEPTVRQPVFLHFDPRGRLWVVNYEQYPNPAGLKMLSRDRHWRAVYDKVPQPPPLGEKGRDRITIHEDTDGDGSFDATKVFVDDLNIATACAVGVGGVWVMNPPYLLFYPDADGDDVPDGDPEVHLEGFGLEDTHSCANSLTWGPDGWLYGAQGSTVSGNVRKQGEKKGTFSMGQNVWRYHPTKRVYEVFAEGGGNAFGIEFDAEGRVYSGHNGGNTRGFHYVQGGYFRKGFGKHGPLSNPYAFGYFEHMAHHDVPRFTHDFVIYEDTALPERYRGQLFGVEPLQGQVVRAEVSNDGSTFKTKDLDRVLTTDEKRFRPVAIETGPDGNLYVADFHEPQISHREHFAGIVENTTGRVFRLSAKAGERTERPDLAELTSADLLERLRSPSKSYRAAVRREFARRWDMAFSPTLRKTIGESDGQFALECLWALMQTTGMPEYHVRDWMGHPHAPVREWVVRIECDDREVSGPVAVRLAQLAKEETDVRVRSQLACSAKRLPAADGLPIVRALLDHNEDAADPHLPLLLWWAIESKCGDDAEKVVAMFEESALWSRPIVRGTILERLMRRFAQPGTRRDLLVCARLLELAPDEESTKRLMTGFEQAFKGRTLTGLPDKLVAALADAGGGSPSLRMRQGDRAAIDEALERVAKGNGPTAERIELIETLGEIKETRAIEPLLALVAMTKDADLRAATLSTLGAFDDPRIGAAIVDLVPARAAEETDDATGVNDERNLALDLLAGRPNWSERLLDAIAEGRIEKDSIPTAVIRKLTLHRNDRIAARVGKTWPEFGGPSDADARERIARYAEVVTTGTGDPYAGKKIYARTCGKCHLLFGEGGRIGPDLTPFKRDDHLNMLANVVAPSAEIREGFETWVAVTKEGRVVLGFLRERDDQLVVLATAEGRDVRLPAASIEAMQRSKVSIMPDGQLKFMTDREVRDLFAYLRSAQPLNE